MLNSILLWEECLTMSMLEIFISQFLLPMLQIQLATVSFANPLNELQYYSAGLRSSTHLFHVIIVTWIVLKSMVFKDNTIMKSREGTVMTPYLMSF